MKEFLKQVSDKETKILLEIAESSLKVEGDFVELGCYRWETSVLLEKLLEKQGSEKKLWIYDSFEGLPKKTAEDASVAGDAFKEKELLVSKREVVERFKRARLKLPIIKKGFFENLDPEKDLPREIAFAFLDGDLYNSIKTSLKLVAPKLAKGGVMVVHDYNNPELPGSARAVDEFLRARTEFRLRIFETLAILSR